VLQIADEYSPEELVHIDAGDFLIKTGYALKVN
jgi:hypothetical protein